MDFNVGLQIRCMVMIKTELSVGAHAHVYWASRGRYRLMTSVSAVFPCSLSDWLSVRLSCLCAWESEWESRDVCSGPFKQRTWTLGVCVFVCCNVTCLDTTYHHLHLWKKEVFIFIHPLCWAKAISVDRRGVVALLTFCPVFMLFSLASFS